MRHRKKCKMKDTIDTFFKNSLSPELNVCNTCNKKSVSMYNN